MKSEKEIYLAGGCFWGAEHFLKQISGVTYTAVGFANGNVPDPTYKLVYTDTTGYAETVHVKYDPTVVSLKFLLHLFFKAIDPTSVNKQGEDEGIQYRTGIYYTDLLDGIEARTYLSEHLKEGYTIKVEKLLNFFRAEEYHQDYLKKNPTGYCHINLNLIKDEEKK
jgi:peptide methionine sulfoxide reductase msrA/msrB